MEPFNQVMSKRIPHVPAQQVTFGKIRTHTLLLK